MSKLPALALLHEPRARAIARRSLLITLALLIHAPIALAVLGRAAEMLG